MFKRIIIYIVLALAFSATAFAPSPSSYTLVCKIPLQGGAFTTDNLQNVYVYEGSTLKKFDYNGKLQYVHSDKSYGAITSVDVYDPMKIMVFYKDFPQIIFLDNTLSQNGAPVNPANMGYPLATLACVSHDNGLWFYDSQTMQLVRFDVNLAAQQKTGNLNQLLGVTVNPSSLIEYNNYVYLNDTTQGIFVFDAFGTYYKTIPVKGLNNFEVTGDDMFYMQGHKIHAFHLKTITEDVTSPPDSLATDVRVEKNMLYEACNDTVRVFEIK